MRKQQEEARQKEEEARREKEKAEKERAEKEKVERERIRDREKLEKGNPERNLDTYNTFSPKELLNELITKEEQELKFLKEQLQIAERRPTKQDKQNQQSQKEPDNEIDDPMISKLKEKIQQLDNNITIINNQLQNTQKEKEQYEQQLKKYI